MGVRRLRDTSEHGQMTIELAVALPVLITVGVIAVNALTFFAQCGIFDRAACDAVRAYAASPAYGQTVDQSCALAADAIESALDADNVTVTVFHSPTAPDLDKFTATLEFSPTLFGRGLRSEVFGVALPRLIHNAEYVIDVYKPGVIL